MREPANTRKVLAEIISILNIFHVYNFRLCVSLELGAIRNKRLSGFRVGVFETDNHAITIERRVDKAEGGWGGGRED